MNVIAVKTNYFSANSNMMAGGVFCSNHALFENFTNFSRKLGKVISVIISFLNHFYHSKKAYMVEE